MGKSEERIAAEYELEVNRVKEALAFYKAHRQEIDATMKMEEEIEKQHS